MQEVVSKLGGLPPLSRERVLPGVRATKPLTIAIATGRDRARWACHDSRPALKGVKSLVSRSLANVQDARNRIVVRRFRRFRMNLPRETHIPTIDASNARSAGSEQAKVTQWWREGVGR